MAKPIDPLIDDFGDPDRSPRAGILTRIAHLFPVMIGGYAVVSALTWFSIIDLGSWSYSLASLPFLLAMVISAYHRDLARLCLRCMEAVRADAPVRVRRHIWQLWTAHVTRGMRLIVPIVLGWVIVFLTRKLTGLTPEDSPWLWVPGDLMFIAALWAAWIHHRYRPWCPYCKNWGEDGHIHELTPDPDPSMTKTPT